jgi:hypothetical protein
VEIKVGGKYKPEVLLAIAQLKENEVADEKCGKVIDIVGGMFGLKPNALPSARTVARVSFLLKAMNQYQLREILTLGATRNISFTLAFDEAMRNGQMLQNFMFYTMDEFNKARGYILGTVKVTNKSADACIDALKATVEQLDSDEYWSFWETFIMGVGNSMSDEARVNPAMVRKLEELKAIITENDSRWNFLTEEQKEDLIKIRKFYCQLHILQNMTPVIVQALLEHERSFRTNDNIKQPSVFILLQEFARFFGNRASSKYDVARAWKHFCDKYGISFSSVPDFTGNRFNILFAIAGCIFFLLRHIKKFHEEYSTQLRTAAAIDVGAALEDPVILSQLHVLAAINSYISGPFWRLTQHSTTIASLTEHAESLIEFLERVKEEPMRLLTGYAPFEQFEEAEEVTERSKKHIEYLDEVSPAYPDVIYNVIEFVSEPVCDYFKRKFEGFLPGGEHYASTADLRTVQRSNVKVESIFGRFASSYHNAPNQRISRRDIKIQAKINKVFEWFMEKSPEEREKILLEAIAAAANLEKDAAEQEKAFQDAAWKKLCEKKEKDDKAASVKSRQAQDSANKVQQYGIFTSAENINNSLQSLNATQKRKAVEANLRYHKYFLKTEPTNSQLFRMSANKQPLDMDTLINNLIELITKAARHEEDEEE